MQNEKCMNFRTIHLIYSDWFKHILFMTEYAKGLGRAKKVCLALSISIV